MPQSGASKERPLSEAKVLSKKLLAPRDPADAGGIHGRSGGPRPRTTKDRLEAREELRRVPLLDEEHNTCIGTAMAAAEAEIMHVTLKKNVDLFVWTPSDMSGVSLDIITHRLSMFKEARPIA